MSSDEEDKNEKKSKQDMDEAAIEYSKAELKYYRKNLESKFIC